MQNPHLVWEAKGSLLNPTLHKFPIPILLVLFFPPNTDVSQHSLQGQSHLSQADEHFITFFLQICSHVHVDPPYVLLILSSIKKQISETIWSCFLKNPQSNNNKHADFKEAGQ